MPMQRMKIVNTFILRVLAKNQKTTKLSPMADDTITQSGIGGLGSRIYL